MANALLIRRIRRLNSVHLLSIHILLLLLLLRINVLFLLRLRWLCLDRLGVVVIPVLCPILDLDIVRIVADGGGIERAG